MQRIPAIVVFTFAAACGGVDSSNDRDDHKQHAAGPDAHESEPSADSTASIPASLRDQLAMFFRLDESGDGPRVDRISGVELLPWQRTGYGAYSQIGRGTRPVPAAVAMGQHIDGSQGHHFATWTHPALDHAGGSFTWAGWVSLDAPSGAEPYTDDQTLAAKWNGTPDTLTFYDHREYRIWHAEASSHWSFEVSRDGLEGPEHSRVVTHPQNIERDRFYFVEAWHDADNDTINLRVSDQRERGAVASVEFGAGVFKGQADLDVGAQNTCTDDHLQGTIDALGDWNRVLTEQESLALWNDGAGLEL